MESVGPHISTDAAVNGGHPTITGSDVRVTAVATAIMNGRSPADLLEHFGSRTLTLGEIYAALSYYYDHEQELAVLAQSDLRASEGREAAHQEKVKRYFLGLDDTLPTR